LSEREGATNVPVVPSTGGGGSAAVIVCNDQNDCPRGQDRCQPQVCVQGACIDVFTVVCDDGDRCTNNVCDSRTGACSYPPATLDLDGDGFRAPLPGTRPGDPGACGNDCNDASAAAYPLAEEVCDGVDNNCDGVIDENSSLALAPTVPLLVSASALKNVSVGNLAYNPIDKTYLASYSADTLDLNGRVFTRQLDGSGTPLGEPTTLNTTAGDGDGGLLTWLGDRYAAIWSDRRTGSYEIYLATLGATGAKLAPDVAVSQEAAGFSVNPALGWNGRDFQVFWQDNRAGLFNVYGQRIALDGARIGNELDLVSGGAESPAVAPAWWGLGLVYRRGTSMLSAIYARVLDDQMNTTAGPVQVSDFGLVESPSIVVNRTEYVVTWTEKYPHRVMGAVVSREGSITLAPKPLSPPGGENRGQVVVPLGDRILVFYSRQEDSGYNVYLQTFSDTLEPQGAALRLTALVGDEVVGGVAFGPAGDLGVMLQAVRTDDPRSQRRGAFFTHLRCVGGANPAP